jgi:hypothetical protein
MSLVLFDHFHHYRLQCICVLGYIERHVSYLFHGTAVAVQFISRRHNSEVPAEGTLSDPIITALITVYNHTPPLNNSPFLWQPPVLCEWWV